MKLDGKQLGDYRVTRFLNQGGMGQIYLAYDTELSRKVVIKAIRDDTTMDVVQASFRFKNEMRTISNLDHKNILPLYAVGQAEVDGDMIKYMVMPYRPEGSLDDWLQQRGTTTLAPADVVPLITQAAEALDYAHKHGIIHRDVKSSNFLVRENSDHPNQPDLLLSDFGLVKLLEGTKTSGGAKGTWGYMAPEQYNGETTVATDQYALAVMTYQLLTGELPFKGNQAQIMYQQVHGSPDPLTEINPRIPKAMEEVVLRALSREPSARYPSIMAYAKALQQSLLKKVTLNNIDSFIQPVGETLTTLSLSDVEATNGALKPMAFTDGDEEKRVHLRIPANVTNGQKLRFPLPDSIETGQVLRIASERASDVHMRDANSDGPSTLVVALTVNSKPIQQLQPSSNGGKVFLWVAIIVVLIIIGIILYTIHVI
jgi:serine/threonine protein kinase